MNDRIPSLGAIFRSLSDKAKSLTPTRYPIEDGYLARVDQQGRDPIALGAIATPPRAVLQYGCSAAASATTPYKSSHGGYGSDINLVQGIEKTTRSEVYSKVSRNPRDLRYTPRYRENHEI